MMAPQAESCWPEQPLGSSPASPPAIVVTRPLFGGYVLVAACAAWLGGVAVQRAGPLAAWAPWIWLIGAASSVLVWAVLQLGWRGRVSSRAQRALGLATAAALLGFWLALGAGRSAWSEVASGPRSVAMLPQHCTLELRGDASAEPLPTPEHRVRV